MSIWPFWLVGLHGCVFVGSCPGAQSGNFDRSSWVFPAGLHGFAWVGFCPCAHGGNFERSIPGAVVAWNARGLGVLATAPAARNPVVPRRMTIATLIERRMPTTLDRSCPQKRYSAVSPEATPFRVAQVAVSARIGAR